MNGKTHLVRVAAAAAIFALAGVAAAQTHYGDKPPAVDDIIKDLGADASQNATAQGTRALRPGAAISATATAEPPNAASISMQIHFDFNSDAISPSSETSVNNLAQAMKSPELAARRFTIVGHTDGKGSAEYNQRLSERRAASVKNYLMRNGVPADRLNTTGRGKNQLLNSADPYAAENRRVEVQASG